MAQARGTIEVLYALTDKRGTYSKFAGASICSLFENSKENIRVHIFHDGSIVGENRVKLLSLASAYGQEILFYNVRQLLPEVLHEAERIMSKAVNSERYTEAALYRLLAPQLLPENISRLIYLDTDTIVHMDIKELWEEKISSNGLSAVFEADILMQYNKRPDELKEGTQKLWAYWQTLGKNINDGFNSGVLLMDLQVMRQRGNLLLDGLRMALACDSDSTFYDQNILIFFFAEEAYHLPWHYNMLQTWERKLHPEAREMKGIYHYMGRSLGMNEDDVRDTLFYDYFLKTPWADGRFLCHFHKEIKELHSFKFGQYMTKVHTFLAAMMTRKPVVAASNAHMMQVCKMLRGAAENPALSSKGKFCNLGEDDKLQLVLPYDVDSHFYLFFVEDYVKLKVMLEQAGLPEENHYMDGRFLLESDVLEKHVNISRFFESL